MPNPTNKDIIKYFEERFQSLEKKVEMTYEYMIGDKAVKANITEGNKSSSIPKEVLDIIKWLVLIIGTLVGAKNIL